MFCLVCFTVSGDALLLRPVRLERELGKMIASRKLVTYTVYFHRSVLYGVMLCGTSVFPGVFTASIMWVIGILMK